MQKQIQSVLSEKILFFVVLYFDPLHKAKSTNSRPSFNQELERVGQCFVPPVLVFCRLKWMVHNGPRGKTCRWLSAVTHTLCGLPPPPPPGGYTLDYRTAMELR